MKELSSGSTCMSIIIQDTVLKYHEFKINDWVTFHTIKGYRVGIIDYILPGEIGLRPTRARITVRNTGTIAKQYTRPLYKLKPVEL